MKFDKPVVLLSDIPELMQAYDFGEIMDAKYLGGVPNVTYRVVTEKARIALRICNRGYTSLEHLTTEISLLEHLAACGFIESPTPLKGKNQRVLQTWHEYPSFAMRLIEGRPGDQVVISAELCGNVGHLIGQMQTHLRNYSATLPVGETFAERGERLLKILPITSREMGWNIDLAAIVSQWQTALRRIDAYQSQMELGIIHSDIWPPNVICEGERIVGVVDFDDWACGPMFIDLAASLAEFPMYKRVEFDTTLATNIFKGFFESGGEISDIEEGLLVDAMEATCVSWLACNALHRIHFEESATYVEKLQSLRNRDYRDEFAAGVMRCVSRARQLMGEGINEDALSQESGIRVP